MSNFYICDQCLNRGCAECQSPMFPIAAMDCGHRYEFVNAVGDVFEYVRDACPRFKLREETE